MNAEILTIGNEILSGHIVNTNAAWLGQQLNLAGIAVAQATSIPDDRDRILVALAEATPRADLTLITGGLGPTKDDVTKKALCDFFQSGLVFNPDVFEDVRRFIAARRIPENELHRQQAMVPRACSVIRNSMGTAPGMWFERDGRIVVAMPGVPAEMKTMVQRDILPNLLSRISPGVILHRSVLIHGISESNLAIRIAPWEKSLPPDFQLASLPHGGFLHLRLTVSGPDARELERLVDTQFRELSSVIGEYIYDFSDKRPEEYLESILKARRLTLAIIESGSRGALANRMLSTSDPASALAGTAVGLNAASLAGLVEMPPEAFTVQQDSAMKATEEMAIRFRRRMKADLALATSPVSEIVNAEENPAGPALWVAVASSEAVVSKQVAVSAYYIDRILFMLARRLRDSASP